MSQRPRKAWTDALEAAALLASWPWEYGDRQGNNVATAKMKAMVRSFMEL
jgi:hypothetical protein